MFELPRARFERVWKGLGAADTSVWPRLTAAYAESWRAYHTEEHLVECFAWLDRVMHLAERPAELEVALWFHDVVYEPRAGDNEERSAVLMADAARAARIPVEVSERLSGLVRTTVHSGALLVGDAALLSDIDLSILGASPARFDRYERQIRQEYAFASDADYRRGRAKVLRGFLERLSIYTTAHFSARLEAQARENLAGATSG